ncbi:MAG: TolC family protein, partial [Balneolaceae bacterium]
FFDNSYWDPTVSVGLQFQWNLFDGFQRSSRMQQNKIEIRQAEIDHEMLEESVWLEVEQAIRDLETAYQRIMSQQRNIERAETNYENALRRLNEGAGIPLEERQASSLLDQSRLSYLSAVHDYLAAKSRFDRVTGKPVAETNP